MSALQTQPAVVVGVDNSAAAMHAALWAVDEAVSRDIPLRLVHILESEGSDPFGTDQRLVDAEIAISRARRAVEATGKPVKLESEVFRGRAAGTLIRLSRQAAMVCLGAVGSNQRRHGQIGSTAAAVAGSAHCSVAIIHGTTPPIRARADVILAATDESPDDGILLSTAVREAVLRNGPLRVAACWQAPRWDPKEAAEGDRRIRAQLTRRLARWRRLYPGVQVETVAVHGDLSEYLATQAAQLQMLIVSVRGPGFVRAVVGPTGNAALRSCNCAVLVVDHQHL